MKSESEPGSSDASGCESVVSSDFTLHLSQSDAPSESSVHKDSVVSEERELTAEQLEEMWLAYECELAVEHLTPLEQKFLRAIRKYELRYSQD